jgi:ribose 5-phosphate isomerase B
MNYHIAIGSDHGGFAHKTELIRYLRGLGHDVKDCGCFSTAAYDFPVSASDVARAVSTKAAERGVMIDGAGSPSAMVANKFTGVRAAVVHNAFTATISREHGDANIISFGAKVVSPDEAKTLVELWLRTDFLGGKYQKRIDMITAVERERSGAMAPRRVVTAEDVKRDPSLADGPGVTVTPLAREVLAARKK